MTALDAPTPPTAPKSPTAPTLPPPTLGPWFHNLHLPDGTQTAPDHFLGDFPRWKWDDIGRAIPNDLTGWSVLDIGCNGGFYSIELARRGASVLGVDHDPRYLNQARWAVDRFGLQHRIELRQLEVYDLAADAIERGRKFDLVMFLGVFYHLRYPLLALDLVADRVGQLLVFQTLTMPGPNAAESEHIPEDMTINDRSRMAEEHYPKMAFIEHRLAGDPTNWWAANPACCEAMLRSAGMRVATRPHEETWVCEPDPSAHRAMNRTLPGGLGIRTPDPA